MNTATILASGAVPNPFDGVTPNFSVFGTELNSTAVMILGGIWGLALLWTGGQALVGGIKWSSASRQNYGPEIVDESATHFKRALVAFGCVVAVPLLFGAIIALLSR
ncbi:hypothetical protein FH969_14970 [Miniimonas arenae]|uniref:Uncharacterized protein n=1 Tax=Miniimonas arenae TaxID=676201 RepID=A0A5C5B8G0_9MICO|nr:hypothetical protein [Miniimonas arenae]TNU72244.1 hypothetical protein FH969_14970 [Miniimonas arenae]